MRTGWARARTLRRVLTPAMIAVVGLPIGVFGFVFAQSVPALRSVGVSAFMSDDWAPGSGHFGAAKLIAGTLASSALAMAVVVPGAISWALRVNFFASPGIARMERLAVSTLVGVPSVVFGLVGLLVLVPAVRFLQPPGLSLLAGSVVLAAMCLPTAAAAADAAVQQVEPSLIAASRALGLGVWDTARLVVLPAAASGLRGACLLGLGRALGETLAVMMVAGNTVAWPSLFAPFRTLNGNVAVEMAYSAGLHRSALFVTGLMLLMIVLGVVLAEHLPVRRVVR